MVSHCDFNLHFPNNWWHWAVFHVLGDHLYLVFEEMFIQGTCSFLNWLVYFFLNFRRSLYILEMKILSYMWFANIFSHFVVCLFTSFVHLLLYADVWWFNSPICLCFLLVIVLLLSYPRNHHQIHCHEDFPLCFLQSFVVLTLTLSSLI